MKYHTGAGVTDFEKWNTCSAVVLVPMAPQPLSLIVRVALA